MRIEDDILEQDYANQDASVHSWMHGRPGRNDRLVARPPHRPVRPSHRSRWVLAVFATTLGANVYLRQLRLVGIQGTIVNFDSRLWRRAVAVRINIRDQFLARRVLNRDLTIDFLGWFDE
jgi:hypothetical protein